jgi:DNA-binding response OmpR family regulator
VETTLLAAIVMRGAVSFKDALEELYGDSRHKSHLNIKHIISSIRKKLTPRKVAISTIKNFGWQIDDENRNRVLQACDSK